MLTRPATGQDLPGIKAIYDHEVLTGISTFDTVPPGLDHWERRLESTERGEHLIVSVARDEVLGYAYSSAYRRRPAYARTRESSVYLAPQAQGCGIGRRLYDELLTQMCADGVRTVVALVALPNAASRALHLACGYRSVGVMHEVGHKLGRWVDTEWFELSLAAHVSSSEASRRRTTIMPITPITTR